MASASAGAVEPFLVFGCCGAQFGKARRHPLARRFGLVECAQGLPFGVGGGGGLAFGGDQIALQLRQLIARCGLARFRFPGRFAQGR